jgi:hypothetical protein
MAKDPKRPEDEDEPSEEEIKKQRQLLQRDWKHDDSRELSERDEERPLKP